MVMAGVWSTDLSLPPNTGEAAMVPTSISGTRTSMPNWALPSTFKRVSSRGVGFPRMRQLLRALSSKDLSENY